MAGFFSQSVLQSAPPISLLPECGACGLFKQCKSPKMEVSGKGERGILIVGEAPGATEDAEGKPFVGEAGKRLAGALEDAGIKLRRDCWMTNSLICRPPKNRTPTNLEIGYCYPNLARTIKELQPDIIIPLGSAAVEAVIGRAWKENTGGVTKWAGFRIPSQKPNAWICPTFHPAALLHTKDKVMSRDFDRHIADAVSLRGKPHDEIPDRQSQVEVVINPDEAARIVRRMIDKGGPVAFDYETTMLKPDHPDARIVSCSVSWRGKKTIAYPWVGEAIVATRELLRSPLPKIASNLKFEERWSIKHLDTRVRNWAWDTMQTAHCHDNRRGTTSIKFQGYVLLGEPSWNTHIEPFLKSPGGNTKNRIEQLDLNDLLRYNGMDSLIEYLVCIEQSEITGRPLPWEE